MPRRRKDCPICGKRSSYLIRAKTTPLDLETILTELYKLVGNTKKQTKWYK